MTTAAGGEYWNEELDTKPWPELQRWQLSRLARALPDIVARSQLYGAKLSAETRFGDLPFTTKSELRDAQENARREAPLGTVQGEDLTRIVQLVSSSGTSGRPVLYGLSARDVESWASSVANMFFTAGIRDSDVVVHLTSLAMVAGGLPFADALRRVGATLAWMGGFPPERVLSSLPSVGATCLSATTSFCMYLTERCEELTGRAPAELGITKLLGGGEPGIAEEETRVRLREAWGLTDVREIMGLSDVMAGMWAECEAQAGMHFTAHEHVYVELIDPVGGEPLAWSEGVTGEVVYTTIDRDATPLIRFRSADQVVVVADGCRCGRTSPRIRCVGRTDDMLIYKGMNVFPSAIRDVVARTGLDFVTPHIRIWKDRAEQVRFDTPIPVEVEAVERVSAEIARNVEQRITQAIREQLQVRADVRLVEPRGIPRTGYKATLVQVRGQGA